MTAIWGPLGWMTLHSVSSLYPDNPTDSEKKLMSTWLDMFRDTITCHYCKSHFTEMLVKYRTKFPTLFNNRREFMAFAFRAHNTVNRRLHKPIYGTLDECMEVLRNNIVSRTAGEYRVAYLTHIRRYWSTMRDTSGFVAMRKIIEMAKIEQEYFKLNDTNFDVTIDPIEVVLPYGILENVEESIFRRKQQSVQKSLPPVRVSPPVVEKPVEVRHVSAGFTITSRGLRLR